MLLHLIVESIFAQKLFRSVAEIACKNITRKIILLQQLFRTHIFLADGALENYAFSIVGLRCMLVNIPRVVCSET